MSEMREQSNAAGPQVIRVLRIGILQNGKIIHERLIKPGQNVTIGESEKNTFVFKSHRLPKRHMLFKAKGDQLALCFTDEMSGMIALPGGVVALKEARANGAAEVRGDSYIIPLNSKSRGKVVIGETTVLFQYVAAPPESARLVARQNFRPVLLEEDDPVFLGFLAIWGALGAALIIYALNSEKVDLVKAEDLPDLIAQLADPTIVEDDTESEEMEGEGLESDDVAPDDQPEEEVPDKDTPEEQPEAETDNQPKTEDEQKLDTAQKTEEARAQTQSSTLFTLAGPEPVGSTGKVTEGSAFVSGQHTQTLSNSANNIDPNRVAGNSFGESAEVARSDTATSGNMEDSNTGGQEAETTASTTGSRVSTGDLSGGVSDVSSVDTSTQGIIKSVIKRRRKQVLDCYNKELAKDPGLKGRLVVDFDIYDDKTDGIAVSGMNSTLQGCVKTRVKAWRFSGVEEAYGIELTYNLQPSG